MDGTREIALRADSSWPQKLSHWESVSIGILNYANVPALETSERATAVAFIAETRARLAPAAGGDVAKVIAKLSIACRHPRETNAADRKALAALMLNYLVGYPLDLLNAATDDWIRTQTFFPSIAEFRALCEPEMTRRRNALGLMERALERSDAKARAAEEERRRKASWTPEKRAENLRRSEEARRMLSSEKPKPALTPRRVDLSEERRAQALANVAAGKVPR